MHFDIPKMDHYDYRTQKLVFLSPTTASFDTDNFQPRKELRFRLVLQKQQTLCWMTL